MLFADLLGHLLHVSEFAGKAKDYRFWNAPSALSAFLHLIPDLHPEQHFECSLHCSLMDC